MDSRTLGFDVNNFFSEDDDPKAREEFIKRLAEVSEKVVYHFVDGSEVQLCDERANPDLIISQQTPPDSEGWVEWVFEFTDNGDVYTYRENVNYVIENEEDLEINYI